VKALLLGNSPALVHPTIDLAIVPRGEIVVFGANRLWHSEVGEWQLIVPDFLSAIDIGIEPEWFPPEGSLHGVVVPKGNRERSAKYGGACAWLDRKDVIERQTQGMKTMEKQFPDVGEPYLEASSTPAFLAQFILECQAFDQIGILGIEYTAAALFRQGQKEGKRLATHWFGWNSRCGAAPSFHGMGSVSYQFWTRFLAHCGRIGVEVRNLSPYPRTPFDKAGIPRMGFESWVNG